MTKFMMAALLLVSGHAARADESNVKIDWPLKTIHVPTGYDDNDNVQLSISGSMPNSCYQIGPTEVKKTAMAIEVHQFAYVNGTICLQVLNPFFKTIDLGRMTRGRYEIVDGASHAKIGELDVAEAKVKPGPDDGIYAPVQDALIGKNSIVLSGFYTDRCMKIVRTPKIGFHGGVVVVQPFVEMQKGENCGAAKIPFNESFAIRANLPPSFLLHVRTMNGHALNKPIGDVY